VSPATRPVGISLLAFGALFTLFAGLAYGGGADAPLLIDPGVVARYGLPLSTLFVHLGAAVAIGALVLACFALDPAHPEFDRALNVAAGSAALWTMASAAAGFFTFATVLQEPVRLTDSFGQLLANFFIGTELGQAWLVVLLAAAAVTALCLAVRNRTALVFVTLGAIASLLPITLQGHRGGTDQHDAASSALFLHVVFAAVWVGGLVTVALLRPTLGEGRLPLVLARYSSVALVCFVVVATSGYINAVIRLDSPSSLLSPYGVLIVVKIVALLMLGLFGALYRRSLIGRLAASPARTRTFWWVAAAELGFMGVAFGAATALARTATPIPQVAASDLSDPTPAQLLTGSTLPPLPTALNLFTLVNIDPVWLLACGFAVFFYAAAVIRLRRRGDSWPIHRTVLWMLGIALLLYITNGGVNAYERFLFSAHMLAHMTLGMLVPLFLVFGAPITLALRAIRKREDGSRGGREWLLLLVHSKPFAVVGHPLVAAGLFTGSLWLFYYTPIFRWATTNHLGHEWMIVHFLGVGYLFVQSLVGIDPAPNRPTYPVRLIVLLATMAMHAFFGLALLSGTGLLLADWYGAMGWPDARDALADQQSGGAIAWSVGEIPTVALAILVAVLWSRSDARESKRYDRKAARDDDAELEEYNEMLARRALADRR